ncbi:hypothetical protein SDC9_159016 [bioreactor metagenome]|uniref:Uncharacterized protein n=1 Tax=bioreactor metagenome TaxID=1076179 RepID=A0A645FED8_9ZZZZ
MKGIPGAVQALVVIGSPLLDLAKFGDRVQQVIRVIRVRTHFIKFFGVQCGILFQNCIVDRQLSQIVQITRNQHFFAFICRKPT